ncbi:GTPase/DUF3482 domain-containing protein [Pseudacidovorax sp. RU35E]|uniref:GTPase/DUF3482 domain-containing protein n=1 Tax=Pseudacidovorax sp. RU35E TaxID=1907403 RepID=UPI000954AEFC|nr:GTPase/DUF3482 domain-containing protein [Pseudacidovorax sp. RU35E]SIR31476.1 small GTP-binding protein domain-containing protein [Pseudacidovorax sp. RU35E]
MTAVTPGRRTEPTAPAAGSDAAPLRIAVVGHTNAGKTSLLRTLTRRVDFGEVSDRPGTTRHVEQIDLRIDGEPAVRFYDTPGLEDAVTLWAHVARLPGDSRPARVRAFLQGPEAQAAFEQEAKVLRLLLDADAAFLVIDTREPVLPKYRDEVELLGACARPVLPVLNFIAHGASREPQWRAMLSDAGLHAVVRFDAAAPFTGAERDLYQDLGTLLPERRETLRGVAAHLQAEATARRAAACQAVAGALVAAAALRRTVATAQLIGPQRRAGEVRALRTTLEDDVRAGTAALLRLYGFRPDDAAEPPLPALEGLAELDLFNPEMLRQAGLRLGQGAAVGAALGAAADLAVGGLSLGAGALIGGTVGGALAQGLGPLGRRLAGRLRGQQDLTVEEAVLYLLAERQIALVAALEGRGHGAVGKVAAEPTQTARTSDEADALRAAVRATHAARAHPEWRPSGARRGAWPAARDAVVDRVAAHLERALGAGFAGR